MDVEIGVCLVPGCLYCLLQKMKEFRAKVRFSSPDSSSRRGNRACFLLHLPTKSDRKNPALTKYNELNGRFDRKTKKSETEAGAT